VVSLKEDTVAASFTVVDDRLQRWRAGFDDVFALVAGRFAQADSRRRARMYVLGLLSGAERKNSWTLAEQAGDLTPDGMQRCSSPSPPTPNGSATKKGARPEHDQLVPLSCNEIRRLWAILTRPVHTEAHTDHWSDWRQDRGVPSLVVSLVSASRDRHRHTHSGSAALRRTDQDSTGAGRAEVLVVVNPLVD
jgi:hypothetical protein